MRIAIWAAALAGVIAMGESARANDAANGPVPNSPPAGDRRGGVLEESYVYRRQSPTANAAASPVGPWHGYGFPVRTYRWGWFGAAHYYPTVLWHRGYYGDQCRWAYRQGY
jgi:hypothetical protein